MEKGNFKWAEQIANECSCPSFTSILAGNSSGKIRIDNLENPSFALVHSEPVGGFSILGKFNKQEGYLSFKSFVEGELFKELKANNTTTFEFSDDLLSMDRFENIKSIVSYIKEIIGSTNI